MDANFLYIDGERTEAASGSRRDVIDPATGKAISTSDPKPWAGFNGQQKRCCHA
ncbi:hypothetical protein M0D69_28390 [Caballeronia sp. SEWSISQ10-4 2]|uniref:hypothetical protein n=1 Tax=Caballeronia sp. SEWSISQ10-4 2 TaxID=2937438 RepID=UPI0026506730|nr:hypothetical protein [Caballeronia sp. SEWSISQ10-4 2]MDN7181857.1 hypothetical protein [Caballeronia sp. SEWSISQ10-4 2]